MSDAAISSALGGISSAETILDAAAQAAAAVATGDGNAAAAIVGSSMASEAMSVNVAVLRTALETERSLINIFA